ncbi:3-hydroxyacyl-CoA dehydrogenase family protein [Pseudovibrio sp. Tun.PSC04-5.I4]|uniref:3-hydroxyacyl-CoA dehydrogenase family protein n=1 Tax=Pseudovibrio sp. Tun.PSC04-5.I4 TaxID=1798213 RepID=UPI000885B8A2|nr:3-hydroxyacyl-CoA dehydrogenase family protein [Pseudovibrio sp. Tun.PSC04-5.I4]SDR48564.1 3-hydroxybutyryl-CoA dehydrogenase [Pseudovibrio sp. Tun.PSC04-5.I4]
MNAASENLKDKKCVVLGAGTMGTEIAFSLAISGFKCTLWARRPASLNEARVRHNAIYDFLVEEQQALEENRSECLSSLEYSADIAEAVRDADFVFEAIVEDEATKKALFSQVETHCRQDTILSSTTSALSPTRLQSELSHPNRFCVAHYIQPAHLMELVEVVAGDRTDELTKQKLFELLRQTGKQAVNCPDVPGFLFARIQHAILREFVSLYKQGLVSPQDCDTLMKNYARRLPAMGPFEHADLSGLDLQMSAGAAAVWADLSVAQSPAETPIGELFGEGKFGMKTGQGFYDWQHRNADDFKRDRDRTVLRLNKVLADRDAKS